MRGKSISDATSDKKNNLIFSYLDFVKEFKPKSFILENVPGLKNDKRINKVENEIRGLGYVFKMKILDAAVLYKNILN